MADVTKFGGTFTNLNGAVQSGKDLASSLTSLPNVSGLLGPVTGGSGLMALAKNGLPKDALSGVASKLDVQGVNVPGLTNPNSGDRPERAGGAYGEVSTTTAPAGDMRIRISPQVKAVDQVYGPNTPDNILNPLRSTMGMMFPFTPSIEWSQQVEYATTSLVHNNQDYHTYKNTPSTTISINGEFVVQHHKEGVYLLAVMHFLRTVSKMYFGKASFHAPNTKIPSLAGMPPPVLILSGYGNYMFNDLPVIVKSHQYSFKPDVSYMDINTSGGKVRLPSIMSIGVSLIVQNTPQKLRDEFDLDKFRTGELMRGANKGWI